MSTLPEEFYRYMHDRFNFARQYAHDAIKLMIQASLAIIVLTASFYNVITTGKQVQSIIFIRLSWIGFLISTLLGFVTFYCIFQGHFNFAYQESWRPIAGRADETERTAEYNKYRRRSDNWYNAALLIGSVAVMVFLLSVLCIVIFGWKNIC